MDLGAKLQQARLEKGLTLAHMSNVTKMSLYVLELIERSEFPRLPGGLLTRGHLRAYASEVGLDPETIVSEYRSEYETADDDELLKLRTSHPYHHVRAPHAGLMLVIGLTIVAFFALFALPRSIEQPHPMEFDGETAEARVAETATLSQAAAATIHSAPTDVPVPLAAANTEGLQIELRPRAECWVSAVADGRLVIYRLMQAGERATIDARDEVQLRVGDAGALTYFVNGVAGRALGGSGEAVTVRMTSDNSATWLTKEPRPVMGI